MNKLDTKQDVYNLLSASTASAAFGAAIETGLLWLLEKEPLDGESVAQILNIPTRRCQYWLQYLHSIGILDKGELGYAPSASTRAAVLETYNQETWKHLALDERERSAGVHSLPLYITEPGSIWAAQGLPAPKDYVEKMRQNPARAREFSRTLFEVHQALAKVVSELLDELLDMASIRRMMDLGGGSGVVSMTLLRKYPALTSTVVDIENVCLAGREIAAEEGLADRISYHPADFARDEFPSGFDLVIKCDVSVFDVALFKKLWQALNPGGRVVFVEHLSPTEDSAPLTRVEWTFLDSLDDPNYRIPTIDQVRSMLAQAGFELLPGEQTFGSGWVVFQARKRT